jgi:protein involved in polysaccharide export with SLBB domain
MSKILIQFFLIFSLATFIQAQYIPSASEIERIKKQIEEAQQNEIKELQKETRGSGLETFSEPSSLAIPASKYVNIDSVLSFLPDTRAPFEALTIFGSEFFRNYNTQIENESFGPVNEDYKIGVGDEVIITIWGEVNKRYETVVNRNGQIYLEDIGNIRLAGKKYASAVRSTGNVLKKYFSSISRQKAFFDLSIGKMRTIRVFIAGQVRKPGVFNVPANTSIIDLIGLVSGPKDFGTMRNILIMSQNEIRRRLDLYPFLTAGTIQETNLQLLNNDIVFVPPVANRIYLDGAVNMPAIYELNEGETIRDLIAFSGGFREDAYRKNIEITRIEASYEQRLLTVDYNAPNQLPLRAGDKVFVHPVEKETMNYIQVNGPVYGPNIFAWYKGITVRQLFAKIDSISLDANLERVEITRTEANEKKSVFAINLKEIQAGNQADITLMPRDVLVFFKENELIDEGFVSIIGAIKNPGKYNFAANMSVNSLIYLAGGYNENAWIKEAEISRIRPNRETDTDSLAELYYVDINKDISLNSAGDAFFLKPYDIVHIRENSNWELQRIVTIKGQVKFPGVYTVRSKNEKLSDIILRAGGLKESAFIQGAFFLRQFDDYTREERSIFRALSDTSSSALKLSSNISAMLLPKNIPSLEYELVDDSTSLANKALLFEEVIPAVERETKKYGIIGIDFETVMDDPDSEQNIVLQDKDVIIIPEQKNTVRVIGAVYNPSNVLFQEGGSLKDYLTLAGGTLPDADESKIFVQLANGKIIRESSFLFYSYLGSDITAGSTIYVPKELPADKINWPATIRDVASILGSVATTILIINNINK